MLHQVQDIGVGILEQNLDKIFDPFFTTISDGQGLGLKVCKGIIKSQNSMISVKVKKIEKQHL